VSPSESGMLRWFSPVETDPLPAGLGYRAARANSAGQSAPKRNNRSGGEGKLGRRERGGRHGPLAHDQDGGSLHRLPVPGHPGFGQRHVRELDRPRAGLGRGATRVLGPAWPARGFTPGQSRQCPLTGGAGALQPALPGSGGFRQPGHREGRRGRPGLRAGPADRPGLAERHTRLAAFRASGQASVHHLALGPRSGVRRSANGPSLLAFDGSPKSKKPFSWRRILPKNGSQTLTV
jgi:hypothetical protein